MGGTQRFTVGAAISGTVRVWLANLLPFSAIALLFNLPIILWSYFATKPQEPSQWVRALLHYQWGSVAAWFLIGGLVSAAVSHGTLQQLRGTRISATESIKVAASQAHIVVAVIILSTLAAGFASILFLVPGIFVWLNYSLAVPAAINEKLGATSAMQRSRSLAYGYRKQIFAAMLFIVALNVGCSYLISLFSGMSVFGAETTAALQHPTAAAMSKIHTWFPISTAISFPLWTITSVFPAVVYAQLRQVKEPSVEVATARVV